MWGRASHRVFVAIADVRLRPGAEGDFAGAFVESNAELSRCEGFVGRRLLKSGDGSFSIVVEHDSRETFERMRRSDAHARWHGRLAGYMVDPPSPRFFQVVAQ